MSFISGRCAELRAQLVHAEAQLNLRQRGIFATTHLGRRVLRDALREATISGGCSFFSALAPLLFAVVLPFLPWLSVLASLLMLALLGSVLGRTAGGSPLIWSMGLTAGGMIMTALGYLLNIL